MTTRASSALLAFAVALATVIAMVFAFGLGEGLICGPIMALGWVAVLFIMLPMWKPFLLLVPLVAALVLMMFVPPLLRQLGGRRFAIRVGVAALVALLAGWGFSALNYNTANNCSFHGA